MSVIAITELQGKGGEQTLTGRSYTRSFHAFTDSINDTQKVIFDILGTAVTGVTIPLPGTEHDDDDTVTVDRVSPRQNVSKRDLWEVDVSYTTRQNDAPETGTVQQKPTDLPPRISFGYRQYSKEMDRAYQGADLRGQPSKAVRNSAGDPFDPQPMVEFSHLVINIVRNETVEDFDADDVAAQYQDTLNSVAINIAGVSVGIHEGKMVKIAADKRWGFDGGAYYEVAYEVEVAPELHLIHVLDRGFYQKFGVDDRRRIMESDVGTVVKGKDRPVSEPQLLRGGLILSDTDPDGANFLTFQPLFALSWKPLQLPILD